jgi:hypothetical protein
MNKVEHAITYIVENKRPVKIHNTVIDIFTANMINTVATKLTEENRKKLFSLPINEMVALSYKIITHRNS